MGMKYQREGLGDDFLMFVLCLEFILYVGNLI